MLVTMTARLVRSHGKDEIPLLGSGRIEYRPETHGTYQGALRGMDAVVSKITEGVAEPVELTPGPWRVTVIPDHGPAWKSWLIELEPGMPEPVDLVDLAPVVVVDGEKWARGPQGERGPEGPVGPKGDPGEGGIAGMVPIFETLAEAQAWEAANPGRMALTVQPPAVDTEPPSPGTLAVSPGDKYADLTVTGATDNFLSVEYSYRAGATSGTGTWSAWTSQAQYALGGLTTTTPYYFQHRVRDGAGYVVEGTPVQATTVNSIFTSGADTFGTHTGSIVGRVMETGGLTWERGVPEELISGNTNIPPTTTSGVLTAGIAALTLEKPQMEATVTIADRAGQMLRVGVATSASDPYLIQAKPTEVVLFGPGAATLTIKVVPTEAQNPTKVTVGYNGADIYVKYGATEVLRYTVGALTSTRFAMRPHDWTVDSVEVRAL